MSKLKVNEGQCLLSVKG